jgi:hypothetical protein
LRCSARSPDQITDSSLFRRIARRIQALAEGGLSERARRRALEIANDADLRIRAPKTKFGPDVTLDPVSAQAIETAILDSIRRIGTDPMLAEAVAAEALDQKARRRRDLDQEFDTHRRSLRQTN